MKRRSMCLPKKKRKKKEKEKERRIENPRRFALKLEHRLRGICKNWVFFLSSTSHPAPRTEEFLAL